MLFRSRLNALLEHVDAPPRRVRITPATRAAQSRVDALLDEWNDEAADQLFAPNVDLDLPREYRLREMREAIEKVGGLVGPAQELSATTPSAIEWVRPGAAGRLKIDIQLMPRLEQRVQTLGVQAIPAPSAELREIAAQVLGSLLTADGQWPDGVVTDSSVDHEAVLRGAADARAVDVATELPEHPSSARDGFDASFALRGKGATTTLKIAVDAGTKVVTHCSFTTAADAWASKVEIID